MVAAASVVFESEDGNANLLASDDLLRLSGGFPSYSFLFPASMQLLPCMHDHRQATKRPKAWGDGSFVRSHL